MEHIAQLAILDRRLREQKKSGQEISVTPSPFTRQLLTSFDK